MEKKQINNKAKQLKINFEVVNSVKSKIPFSIKNDDSVKVIPLKGAYQFGKMKEQELVNYVLKNTKSF
jgi:hypothetical protein